MVKNTKRRLFLKIKNFFNNFFSILNNKGKLIKDKISIEKIESDIQKLTIPKQDNINKTQFDINNKSIVRFWFFGLLFVGLGYFFVSTIDLLLLIFTAFIISIAIESTILFFSRFMNRGLSIFLSYLLFLFFVIFIIIFLISFIISQSDFLIPIVINLFISFKQFLLTNSPEQIVGNITWLPNQIQSILLEIIHKTNLFQQLLDLLTSNVDTFISIAKSSIYNITGFITNFLSFLSKFFIYFGLSYVLSILFSIEKNGIVEFLSGLSNNKLILKYKIEILYKKLGLRLHGQFFLMILVGFMTWISLMILNLFGLNIEGTGSLGLLVGTLDVIPYLGPILGSIPVILVGIQGSGWFGGLVVLIVFILIQQIESNILVPLVMGKSVGVSSVVVFLSMIIGGSLLGILGVFLAVPFAVIATLLFSDKFYK